MKCGGKHIACVAGPANDVARVDHRVSYIEKYFRKKKPYLSETPFVRPKDRHKIFKNAIFGANYSNNYRSESSKLRKCG